MQSKFVIGAIGTMSAVLSLAAAAQTVTTLPANVIAEQAVLKTDIGVTQADSSKVQLDELQLQADKDAGNTAAVTADKATLSADKASLSTAMTAERGAQHQLATDASSILDADKTAVRTATSQLEADVKADKTSALSADLTALQNAGKQLVADQKTIFAVVTPPSGSPVPVTGAVQLAQSIAVGDSTAVQAAQNKIELDTLTLQADKSAHNTAAVTADKAALSADSVTLKTDLAALNTAVGQLKTDTQTVLSTDKTALQTAITQLNTAVKAGNTGVLSADRLAVINAQLQLHADQHAIFGPVFPGSPEALRQLRHR